MSGTGERGGEAAERRGTLAAVRDYLRSPANVFTGLRLLSIPVLWVLAFQGHDRALGIGIALAFATDMIDGFLARRLKQETEIGSRTDSLADHLLTSSTCIWLVMLRPEFFRAHAVELVGWCALAAVTLGVAWIKYRRFVDLHLYSAKLAVFLAYTWAVLYLATGRYEPLHWYAALVVATFASLEALVVLLLRRNPDEHLKSAIFLFVRGREGARES